MLRIKLFVVTLALGLTGAVYAGAQDAAHQHGAHKQDDAAGCCKMAGHKSDDKSDAAHSCRAHQEDAGCCGSKDSCPMTKPSAKDASAQSAEHEGGCCDKAHRHGEQAASTVKAEKMSCCAAQASCCADGAGCCKAHKQDAAKATAKAASGEDKAGKSCCAEGSSCCRQHVARR